MGIEAKIIDRLQKLVFLLVRGDYQEIEASGSMGRLNQEQIKTAISEYGEGQLTLPPDVAFQQCRMFKLEHHPEYTVAFDLWIDDEPSDLTLTCDVLIDEKLKIIEKFSIDDLHVL